MGSVISENPMVLHITHLFAIAITVIYCPQAWAP